MRKALKTLAQELDFNTEDGYKDYIIQSYINGNLTQVKQLFKEMRDKDRKDFLINYLPYTSLRQIDINSIFLACIEQF